MSILKQVIKEMGGVTGAGSIASNTAGPTTRQDIKDRSRQSWVDSAKADASAKREDRSKMYVDPKSKQSLDAAKEKMKKKKSLKHKIKKFFGLGEAVDMNDAVSRFKDLETGATDDPTVTYGVEDDLGNLMKITVKSDVAKEFEERLSQEIQKNMEFSQDLGELSQKNTPSMAEVLFKLKDDFEIIDVEFPTIPKNAVYKNPGMSTSEDQGGVGQTDLDNDLDYEDGEFGEEGDMAGAEGGPDEFGGGMGDGMDDEFGGDMGAGGDVDGGLGADTGDSPEGDSLNPEDDFSDDASVEDFQNGPAAGSGVEGLLNSILQMLQADAEAKKAQADAEAEKAKALQAEYSAKAAKASIEQQTELLSMEEEISKQKQKEKESKKLSDLAKYRVQKSNSYATESVENKSKFIDKMLFEFDIQDGMGTLMRQKNIINMQFRINPEDDAETKKFKMEARRFAMQELVSRMRRAKSQENFDSHEMAKKDEFDQEKAALDKQQNGGMQNQQGNQQMPQKTRQASQVSNVPSRLGSMR